MPVVVNCCVWWGYRVLGFVCAFRLVCWNVLLPLWFDFVVINNTGSPFYCCYYFHFADLSASDWLSHYFLSSQISCAISLRWALSLRSHLSYPNSQCSCFNLKERKKGETTTTWMIKDLNPPRGKKLISCWQLLMLATLGQKWVLFFLITLHFSCAVYKVLKMTVLTLASDYFLTLIHGTCC